MDKLETCKLTEIVIDTQNGVDGAFERLYKETIKFSYRVACVILKNEDDIEDALQSSYMHVARYIKDLRDPKSFESWLSTIVRNECRKHIAREKKVSDIFASVISSKEFELLSEESISVDLMEKSEIIESVRLIVDKLPDEKRACIMLYYFEENTLPEISEILGIPEGTVKSRLYSGRKILEKELKKLQKKDETFYGVSVVPLVTAFFAYQMKNIVVPASIAEGAAACIAAAEGVAATAVASAAAAGTSAAGAGTAATGTAAAAGTSAVTSVVGTAGAAVATKVAAVAVAAAVATGGGVATVNYVADKREAQLTTVPQTSVTEEYTTAPAFAEKTTLVFPETTTLLTTVLTTKKAETTAVKTTSAVSQTKETSTVKAVKTTRKATTVPATTTASTTVTGTTVKATTTVKTTTTAKETTTAKVTTTEITTTHPTTRKETTTAALTTDASEIYNVSGGILSEYTGEGGSVAVPSTVGGENVTAIGTGAFAGNSAITSVSIPSTVTKIGQEAFLDCTGLKSVSLPSSLQSIGIGSFCGCTSLTSVDIPSGVKTIGDDAFADCSSLSTVTIPSSVTSIGENAFGGCNNLTIRCSEGSAAHDYAVENSINFELI